MRFLSSAPANQKTVVTGIESFRKQLKQAQAGDNVGLILADVSKEDVQRGDVLTGPTSGFGWRS